MTKAVKVQKVKKEKKEVLATEGTLAERTPKIQIPTTNARLSLRRGLRRRRFIDVSALRLIISKNIAIAKKIEKAKKIKKPKKNLIKEEEIQPEIAIAEPKTEKSKKNRSKSTKKYVKKGKKTVVAPEASHE